MMKISVKEIKKIVAEEKLRINKQKLNENVMLKGVPPWLSGQLASSCTESLKVHLIKFVNESGASGAKRRQMLGAVNQVLDKLTDDIREDIEASMQNFSTNI